MEIFLLVPEFQYKAKHYYVGLLWPNIRQIALYIISQQLLLDAPLAVISARFMFLGTNSHYFPKQNHVFSKLSLLHRGHGGPKAARVEVKNKWIYTSTPHMT